MTREETLERLRTLSDEGLPTMPRIVRVAPDETAQSQYPADEEEGGDDGGEDEEGGENK